MATTFAKKIFIATFLTSVAPIPLGLKPDVLLCRPGEEFNLVCNSCVCNSSAKDADCTDDICEDPTDPSFTCDPMTFFRYIQDGALKDCICLHQNYLICVPYVVIEYNLNKHVIF